MADKYILNQSPVEAMQHDGTTARAYEILAWVYRNNGTGSFQATELKVAPIDDPIAGNEWVVLISNQGFASFTNDAFVSTYVPAY
jgi:hypothetical protein